MRLARALALALTVVALVLASRLELAKDLTTLFPRTPEAQALARMTRAFGGGDVALVLVRGDDPVAVERAAAAAEDALRTCPVVRDVIASSPPPQAIEPTEAWRFAGPVVRERLARAVSDEGMRERLRETRALLLAPGAAEIAQTIARDPLRLAMIPWEDRLDVAAGARGLAGEAFVADGGRSRVLVVDPLGNAFAPGEAARFTRAAGATLDRARAAHPAVRIDLTGGHVVAYETEALLREDLTRSGALSIALAALVFVVTFRRLRALVAVLPPLLAGTLWTTALAALLYPNLSAVATAFAAVVVGVGVDTGVHVYAKLLEARRSGIAPAEAAAVARRESWRPTLGAALAAAGAFGCLALSEIEGMRQLGVLCAAGEVLTAIAILLVVPDVGALLERGAPPPQLRGGWAPWLTKSRPRAVVALVVVAAAAAPALLLGPVRVQHAVATLDARLLPSLATYEAIYGAFGGTRGQLLVVSSDESEQAVRARSDAVAEAADRLVASGAALGFDALGRFAPAEATQRARLAERDRLDLPSRRSALERALEMEGFDLAAVAPALDAFANPSSVTGDPLGARDVAIPELRLLRQRHVASDGEGMISVVHVRAAPGREEEVTTTLRAADTSSTVTGFSVLERALAQALERDLPRVLAGALLVVVVVLGASLRRPGRVALALLVLVVEVAIVAGAARLGGVEWHVYDALVVPVLFGITLDEVLFLIEAIGRKRSVEEALREQAPLGAATALTTAAGFGALMVCRFGGLADVGKVGALGSIVGLVVAVVVVPAVYRLRRIA